jgi:hypothetical protein
MRIHESITCDLKLVDEEVNKYLREYPPAGYGTRETKREINNNKVTITFIRSKSCD